MQIHNLKQGSAEWHALRAVNETASEASAMMGASKRTSRNELLRLKATGSEKEFSEWQQRNLLDKGHGIEKRALPLAVALVGQELYPCTATSDEFDNLLASFDGCTMDETTIWECKSWNELKAECVRNGEVPEEDFWQVVQQLIVSRAERCLYMVTDGTKENTVSVWVTLAPRDEKRLLAGWAQFRKDLSTYEHVEAKPQVVAAPVAGLPAITYKLNGLALTSNLDVFRRAAEQAVIDSKKELKTDQDFADRDALNKAFGEAEVKIRNMREQVIGEVEDIDKFTRALGEIGELIRQARLAGEKQVATRKEAIKLEIRQGGESAIAQHIAGINATFGGKVTLPRIIDNFAAVMKNKRTITTLQGAVDDELARLKIEADEWAELINANLEVLRAKANNHVLLFRDCQELVQKDTETLTLLVDKRISDYEAEQERLRLEKRIEQIRDIFTGVDDLNVNVLENRAAELESVLLGPHWGEFEGRVAALKSEGLEALRFAIDQRRADDESRRQEAVAPQRDADLPSQVVTGQVVESAGARGAPVTSSPVSTRQPDLLDTAQASSNGGQSVQVANKLELLKAVIRGDVPDHVIAVDMDALLALCVELKRPVAGVTLSEA